MWLARRDSGQCGLVSEGELLGCVPAQQPVDAMLGGNDFGAGGDVEVGLAGVVELDAVSCADFRFSGGRSRRIAGAATGSGHCRRRCGDRSSRRRR